MDGNSTIIKDPSNPTEEPKRFTFDYSYWSHDGFKILENGYFAAENKKYADQQIVFDNLGQGVLDNAWNGYNCCLFAYGQDSAENLYSMMGCGVNKGIVPIVFEELFKGIESKKKTADKSKGEEYQVSLSMMEIYNDRVQDLLQNSETFNSGGLVVRQNPKLGIFYVVGLTTVTVESYADIHNRINEGTRNRTGRSHSIVSISFAQKGLNDVGENMTKTSTIKIVDLALSDRVSVSGATGNRLKETANINKSLSALCNVFSAITDRRKMVPYRDSVLTKMMQEYGGNDMIVIGTISPADFNFDQTLSVLRYVDRVKRIRTHAIVDESPTDKMIRELKEKNARLIEEFEKSKQSGEGTTETIQQGFTEAGGLKKEKLDLNTKCKELESENNKLKSEVELHKKLLKDLETEVKELRGQAAKYQGAKPKDTTSAHLSASSSVPDVTTDELLDLAKELSKEWKRLGVYLGFTMADVDRFEYDDRGYLLDAIFRMLESWNKKATGKSKRSQLTAALEKADRNDLAAKVKNP